MSPAFVERQLALVLLDIIGSTAFVQKNGAKVAAAWFQVHDRLTRSLVYKHQGREIDRSDGFLLSFDDPLDAVNFALRYQEKIPNKTPFRTRIGIHWTCIVEVEQDEGLVIMGAKRVELEGIGKNIAARTMSVCGPGQVLLTSEVMQAVKYRTSPDTPKKTRFACVGLYQFKGVKDPVKLFAVGVSIESLQPPPSSEKVKRLAGPKEIKSKLKHMKIKEIALLVYNRLAIVSFIFWIILLIRLCFYSFGRDLLGVQELQEFIKFVLSYWHEIEKRI